MFIKTWAFCQLKITSPVNSDKIHFFCVKNTDLFNQH